MSDLNCITTNPLQRDGTSQVQRMLEALNPGYAKLHEFSLRDWMLFAYQFSKKLSYYGPKSDAEPQSDWSDFLIAESELDSFIKSVQSTDPRTVEPHLALFVCFIKLLENSQTQLNTFTKRHLDFYYKEVLQIAKKPATPDKVHVIFELAKNVTSYKLQKDTLVDAGKDQTGKPLSYKVSGEPVINQAKVALFKSVLHNKTAKRLQYAEIANSSDGLGAPVKKEDPSWYAFGFNDLPFASIGFSVASPILFLKEGKREITLAIELSNKVQAINCNNLLVQLTGEKGWITAKTVNTVTSNNYPESITSKYTTAQRQNLFVLKVTLDESLKPITAYNSKVHLGQYFTNLPVLRCLFDTSTEAGYSQYLNFSKLNIISSAITVDVSGIQNYEAENDLGKVDATKPFLPFGPLPKKGSNLIIRYPEIFIKDCKTISFIANWKDLPDNMADHYAAYRTEYINGKLQASDYKITINASSKKIEDTSTTATIKDKTDFTALPSIVVNKKSTPKSSFQLFKSGNPTFSISNAGTFDNTNLKDINDIENEDDRLFAKNYLTGASERRIFDLSFNPNFDDWSQNEINNRTKDSYISIQLERDFLHQYFPLLYSVAISKKDGNVLIPNEPYTPNLSSLTLSYSATVYETYNLGTTNNVTDVLKNYRDRKIQFFHESAFGQKQQHIFLLQQQDFNAKTYNLEFLPNFPYEGELYMGVSGVVPETIVSLLFQVAEGSENPESKSFGDNDKIQWAALCNNSWRPLNSDYVVENSTNNLLRTGIVKFLIPKDHNNNNTLLPKGYYWLRAQLPENIKYDSVCKFINVLAQAEEAEFLDRNNDPAHLETSLPAESITKILYRPSEVKGVIQPYSSFGGLSQESDEHFYIRVSERLRHKNRAVTIWDYEHLVLEQFPTIYKVKCLNHTSPYFELDPGYVRIIPIPDLRNKNLFDLFRPRVSQNTLREIEDYLMELNSMQVECEARNPIFETVKFEFKVKFYKQFDPNAYVKILNNDIKKFLSPWAYGDFWDIEFGGILYKSQVIAFIEGRTYVDYITDLKMFKDQEQIEDIIKSNNSGSILTTEETHLITTI